MSSEDCFDIQSAGNVHIQWLTSLLLILNSCPLQYKDLSLIVKQAKQKSIVRYYMTSNRPLTSFDYAIKGLLKGKGDYSIVEKALFFALLQNQINISTNYELSGSD